MLASSSTFAEIDFYQDDTRSFSLIGEIDVFADLYFEDKSDYYRETERASVSLELILDFVYLEQLTETISTIGAFSIVYYDDELDADDIYLGVISPYGSIFVGESGSSLDHVIELTDITNDGVYAFDSDLEEEGKGIRYENGLNELFYSLDVQVAENNEEHDVDNEWNLGVSYTTDRTRLALAASDGGQYKSALAIGFGFQDQGWYLAGLASRYEGGYSRSNGYFDKGTVYGAAMAYRWDYTRVYSSLAYDVDRDSSNRAYAYTLGIDYLIDDKILLFGEYHHSEHDLDNWQTTAGVLGIFYLF